MKPKLKNEKESTQATPTMAALAKSSSTKKSNKTHNLNSHTPMAEAKPNKKKRSLEDREIQAPITEQSTAQQAPSKDEAALKKRKTGKDLNKPDPKESRISSTAEAVPNSSLHRFPSKMSKSESATFSAKRNFNYKNGDMASALPSNSKSSGTSNKRRATSDEKFSGRPPQHKLDARKKELAKERAELPIASRSVDIRQALRLKGNVLILIGETGSGKSTQLPQFLLTERAHWLKEQRVNIKDKNWQDKSIRVGGMIGITQPRRVAAVSVAQRVADEQGSYLAKDGMTSRDTVGYAVRFEHRIPPNCLIKFMTEGTLLQEMLNDPYLTKYSVICVDEVHERSVDVDLVLGFLKMLVNGDLRGRGGIPLKIVMMSATANVAKIKDFFASPETSLPTDLSNGQAVDQELTAKNVSNNRLAKWMAATSSSLDGTPGRASSEPPHEHANELEHDEAIEDGGDVTNHKVIGHKRSSSTSSSSSSSSAGSIRSNYSSWSGLSDAVGEGDTAAILGNDIMTEELAPYNTTLKSEYEFEHDELAKTTIAGTNLNFLKGKDNIAVLYIKGRQHPVSTLYTEEPVDDVIDAAFETVFHIHQEEPLPGDILVFLTGQDEINSLKARVEAQAAKIMPGCPPLEVVPLYGQLSIEKQKLAFASTFQKNARKVIIATNIAETSITVPGIRYVVDSGRVKIKEYRPHLGLSSLLPKPISKSSAIQRKGRAGRMEEGKVIRLYTEQQFREMADADRPEILRTDIVDSVLKMKARGIVDVFSFPLMDPPPRDTMANAVAHLYDIGALDEHMLLTAIGQQMAHFPISASYSRVLVAAAQPENDCLLEAIDAIAVLSGDDIFQQPQSEDEREIAEEARKDLLRREGDILTQLTAMQRYCSMTAHRKQWCDKHLINDKHMEQAFNIRTQLRRECLSSELLTKAQLSDTDDLEFVPIAPERAETLLRCFLTAFVTKTASLDKDGQYKTTVGKHTVIVHPSSVMHGKKKEAIMYLEHVYTNKNYAKKVSGIQLDWIAEAMAKF